MSRPFARGCVVVRGSRFGVVWADRGTASLELLPLMHPEHRHLNDVQLELSDLIACAAPIAHAVIRPTAVTVSARDYVPLGTVPGPTMCRVVQAFIRETRDTLDRAKWTADREHRREHMPVRPVNLAV